MEKTIKHNLSYQQSPEEVWEYLTVPELMAQWLMPNDFAPVVGQDFQFRTKPIPSLGLDGIFYCKVLEIVPLKKLVYSWKAVSSIETSPLDTIVTWVLLPKGTGTELQLVHTGFKEANISIFMGMDKGWLSNMEKVVTLLNTKNNANTNT